MGVLPACPGGVKASGGGKFIFRLLQHGLLTLTGNDRAIARIPKRPALMKSLARHLLRLTAVAVLGFQAASAFAGDLLPPPPPPPGVYAPPPAVYAPQPIFAPAPPPVAYHPLPLRKAVYGWSGTYVGGFVGPQCADIVATVGAINGSKSGAGTETRTFDGCTAHGGLMAGYNVQYDQLVYGFEADYAMTGDILTKDKDGSDVGMDPLLTLRGRIGYGFGSTLAYVTGGAAFARGYAVDDANWHLGWVAGVGLEQKVSDNLGLRAEFLHANFGEKEYGGGCCGDLGFENVNMARLGLTWSFGQMIAPSPPQHYPVQVGG
jgi:outer membrane immunogenic protein